MTGQGPAAGGPASGSGYGARSFEDRQAHREQMMSNIRETSQQDRRVYVGNLSYDVKWHHLKDFMRSGTNFRPLQRVMLLGMRLTCLRATAGEVLFADVLLLPNGMSKVGFK